MYFSIWQSNAYIFLLLYCNSSGFMCFESFHWKMNTKFYRKIWEHFPIDIRETALSAHGMKSYEKIVLLPKSRNIMRKMVHVVIERYFIFISKLIERFFLWLTVPLIDTECWNTVTRVSLIWFFWGYWTPGPYFWRQVYFLKKWSNFNLDNASNGSD